MLRFYFVIITALIFNFYFIPQMWYYSKHPEKYSEADCYKVASNLVHMIKKRGRITTITNGVENLPKDNGYVIYANHQGKYDMLGIVATHDKPLTIIIDKETTKNIIPLLFTNLIQGKKLDKKDPRQQVSTIHQVINEIKDGRRYLIFPEGGYSDNKNTLQEFHPGSFKIPLKTKCPIIPVAIYNSYKPFSENSIKKVTTQVHYLEPIFHEQYASMSSREISNMVYDRISRKIAEIEDGELCNEIDKAV